MTVAQKSDNSLTGREIRKIVAEYNANFNRETSPYPIYSNASGTFRKGEKIMIGTRFGEADTKYGHFGGVALNLWGADGATVNPIIAESQEVLGTLIEFEEGLARKLGRSRIIVEAEDAAEHRQALVERDYTIIGGAKDYLGFKELTA